MPGRHEPAARAARRQRWVLLWSAACTIACVRAAAPLKVPDVPFHGSLGLAGLEGSAAEPFRVVLGSPTGDVDVQSQVRVLFSRPLRELSLAEEPAPPPIRLSPALAGKWHWIGSHALSFEPDARQLPYATKFIAEVPLGTAALDGSRLTEPFRFSFETPSPRLTGSYPAHASSGLGLDFQPSLTFNQPIAVEALKAALSLSVKQADREVAIGYDLDPPRDRSTRFTLHAHKLFPRNSQVTLRIAESLRGVDGPETAGSATLLEFSTYAAPAITQFGCSSSSCYPGESVSVAFNNPVRINDFKRALRVEPPVKLSWYDGYEPNSEERYFAVEGRFRAGQRYRISIAGQLKDSFGQLLGQVVSREVVFADHPASAELGVAGKVIEAANTRALPIGLLNVDRAEVLAGALTIPDLFRLDDDNSEQDHWDYLAALASTRRLTLTNAKPRNNLDEHRLALDQLMTARRGALAVGLRTPAADSGELRVLQVTDLALSAKLAAEGSVVWVTQLSTGLPVPGAKVELHWLNGARREWVADGDGLVRLTAKDFTPDFERNAGSPILVARAGDDWAFRHTREFLEEWRYSVSTRFSSEVSDSALVFADRGIYRPGDDVSVKGLVRTPGRAGNVIPKGKKLSVTLHDPEGNRVAQRAVVLGDYGSWSAKFRVPPAASLGSWRVSTHEYDTAGKPREAEVGGTSFSVAEYRPAEFLVSAEAARPSYVRGDEASWVVRGDFLYGAPMSGAPLASRITHVPTYFTPPNADDFVTNRLAYYDDVEESSADQGLLSSTDGALDAAGTLAVRQKLDLPTQHGPELLTLDAEVTDVSRQTGAGSSSVLVHPAEFYVGIRQLKDMFVKVPGTFTPEVVALAPSGQRLAGKRITLELIHRKWSVLRRATAEGGFTSTSKRIDTTVASCSVQSALEVQRCALQLTQPGAYLVRATSQDMRHNTTSASLAFYGVGPGETWWGDDDSQRLNLVLNKAEYRLGDVAHVMIKSPFPQAEALVTVERNGVLHSERRTLSGSTPVVDIPITEDMRPNAFVSVLLVRPRTTPLTSQRALSVGAPSYRLGFAEIALESASRRLKVDVVPSRGELAPGDEVEVTLTTRRADGSPTPAEVTVYAVDEGALALTQYRTPDPLPIFTAPQPLQVATLEGRDVLASFGLPELKGLLGLDKGKDGGGGDVVGGAGAAGDRPRRDLRQSAYFNPAVLTDALGQARVRFKLPESLTTFRVMAVAATNDDRYGYGSARVVTSKPLMARPALPRFLRAGDQFEASVIVSTKGMAHVRANVRVQAPGLELIGPREQSAELAPGQAREVRFPFVASRALEVPIRFDVVAGGVRDAVEVKRRVEVPTVLETVALYGKTERSLGEKLAALEGVRRDVGSLQLGVASTALIGLDAGFEQLIDYPYGCSEQLASRLVPLLPLRALAKDFSIALPSDLGAVVEKTVAELRARQRSSGGFAFWPGEDNAYPWVSAYVLWSLNQAAKHGVAVPPVVLERGRAYLRAYLGSKLGNDEYGPTSAFMLDVLAELGHPDEGYAAGLAKDPEVDQRAAGQLIAQRAQLPLFAKALLAHALSVMAAPRATVRELTDELQNAVRLDARGASIVTSDREYAALFDSTARTQALVLRALLASDAQHALAEPLARGLLAQRQHGRWRSTQETAYALLALEEYRQAQESRVPDFVARTWLGDKLLQTANFEGRDLRVRETQVAMADLDTSGVPLVFEKTGSGAMFYEVRLRYARSELPRTALDRGFFVHKSLRPYDEKSASLVQLNGQSSTQFPAGQLVIVDLFVVAPGQRNYVVIDDPLPAGFEAVDTSLATTSERWSNAEASGATSSADFSVASYRRELRDNRALFFVDEMTPGIFHFRYLARATTHGQFVLPPTQVEAMYSPELFGRTAAQTIVVQ